MPTLNIKGFPDQLYRDLAEQAKREHRSVTGEVIHLLEWALKASSKDKKSIVELRGLRKNHWKGVDASKHVAQERESWE